MESRENIAFWVLGLAGPANYPAWENILLLVADTGGMIQDNPNVYPAFRHLVAIKLGSINGKYQDHIVDGNATLLDGSKIVAAVKEINIR
jgi:hypothetical protein